MKSNIIFRHIRVPRQAEVWGNAVFSHGRAKAPSGFHRPFVFSGKGRKRICLCFCESGQDVVIRFRAVAKSPVRTEMRRFVLRKCEERKEYRSVIFLRPVWSMRSRSVCGRKKLVPRGGSGARRGKFMDGNGVGRGREWSPAWADGGVGPDRGYGSKDRRGIFPGEREMPRTASAGQRLFRSCGKIGEEGIKYLLSPEEMLLRRQETRIRQNVREEPE